MPKLPPREKANKNKVKTENGVTTLPDVTAPQIDFCLHMISGKNISDSYRLAFPERAQAHASTKALNFAALTERRKPEVQAWLAITRAEAMKSGLMSHGQYNELLMECITDARGDKHHGAVGSMMTTLGKSMGFLTEKVEVNDERTSLVEQVKRLETLDKNLARMFKERFNISDTRDLSPIDIEPIEKVEKRDAPKDADAFMSGVENRKEDEDGI